MKWAVVLVLAAALVSAGAGLPAHAQQPWPQKAVKLIVPFPPGGVTDGVARITAEWLSGRLGHPVVAENRPGASGAIAAEQVARAAPDGYTLFVASAPQLAILPYTQKVSYDPVCNAPAEFARTLREDLLLWAEAVRAAGVPSAQ